MCKHNKYKRKKRIHENGDITRMAAKTGCRLESRYLTNNVLGQWCSQDFIFGELKKRFVGRGDSTIS